ncbi:MAG: ABC transporter ATP-binding protein [Rhodospirillaceae bacterium]|jgi:branched-chain amino acid transport system ATP-binding protein|nr:ABC transporter ATP-binding protein [Rhodospirillaceae bacterium]MBT5456386.1 ABC transporter ATP-binding protein [Rhodospirillaceae bacterium]
MSPPESAPVLNVDGLHSYYGRAHILADVALNVGHGEVVALMGRNGAGKSTTMKCIMGLVRAAKGRIELDGSNITGQSPYQINRCGLAYVPEDRRIFTDLTVLENLEVGRQAPRDGAPTWTPDRLFQLFPNLGEMRTRPGGQMSGGEQQMLTIARSLMGNPSIVLLDEPSEGLAPVIVEQMARTIQELKAEGLTVVLSEQNLHFAMLVSNRAYIIEKGRIRYEGSMDDLVADEEVRQAYLTV